MSNSKARDLASLLSGSGTGTIAPALVSDQNNTSTGFFDLPEGTTAERPSNPATGYIRFNTTLQLAEYYDGAGWKPIDTPPAVTSSDTSEIDSLSGSTTSIDLSGDNFQAGATVKAIGSDGSQITAGTVVVTSRSQITATFTDSDFSNAGEPYAIRVTNTSGLSGELANAINVDSSPSWVTANTSPIADITEDATGTHVTVSATDPDGDTITYSESTSILSGAGLSINSSTGEISGDPTDVGSNTTYSFTLTASANGKTANKAFSIITRPPESGGTIATYEYNGTQYKVFTFTADGTLFLPNARTVDILVVGGGGAGAGGDSSNYGAGGGSGGAIWRPAKSITSGSYNITVGDGGAWTNSQRDGVKGENSVFTDGSYTLTGLGGGGGSGVSSTSTPNYSIMNGGSGGGVGRDGGSQAAGSSLQTNNEDSSAYAYGFPGGTAGGTSCTSGGGGGGLGEKGYNGGYDCQTARSGEQSEGGDGLTSLAGVDQTAFSHFMWAAQIGTNGTNDSATRNGGQLLTTLGSRPSIVYLGGGGASSYETDGFSQLPYGGLGGGGRGGSRYPSSGGQSGSSGYANTGSGGGGNQTAYDGAGTTGGNGGSGVVIVRYAL